jgi:hypothetical protein
MERKAYRDANQDGLIQIFLSIFFFAIAGYLGTRSFPIILILLPIFTPIWMKLLKNKFTYPRIGYVVPSKNITKYIVISLMIYMEIVILNLIIIPLFLDINSISYWEIGSLFFLGTSTIIFFVYLSIKLHSKIYQIISVISLISLIINFLIQIPVFDNKLELFFLTMSFILFFTGLLLFIQFIRKVPIADQREIYG